MNNRPRLHLHARGCAASEAALRTRKGDQARPTQLHSPTTTRLTIEADPQHIALLAELAMQLGARVTTTNATRRESDWSR